MDIIIVASYFLISFVHLLFCFQEKETARKITKLLLMPFLLILYCTFAKDILPGIVIALCAGFLGDLFLIRIEQITYFMIGLSFFFLGHVFYIISILKHVSWDIGQFIAILALLLMALLFMYRSLVRKMPKNLQTPGLLYVGILLCLLGSSLLNLWQALSLNALILTGGALLFCLSDYLLARSTFLAKMKKENFYIMLTYILAQTCIIVSFL